MAILASGFRDSRHVRNFPGGFTGEAAQYRPEVLAGGITVLRNLALAVQRRTLTLPSVEVAVVVLNGVDGSLLTREERGLLWDAFGVPVYEQLIGARMETFAAECGAHHGLHVIHRDCPTAPLAAMFQATIVEAPCPCGQPGIRLLAAAPVEQPLRVFAQSAGHRT